MQPIQCFLLVPTTKVQLDLRRYRPYNKPESKCPATGWTHDAHVYFDTVEETVEFWSMKPSNDDPRWPRACGCGYVFEPDDEWQLFNDSIYTRSDTGQSTTMRTAPVGAMWRATWFAADRENADGHKLYGFEWDNQLEPSLIVKTPGGDWNISGRASNCTLPNDKLHRCWIRHGEPPVVTVDKSGVTCNAGAGSILVGGWHGFLRSGYLVE